MKPRFRPLLSAALLLSLGLFSTRASAGVTGVKFVNDYTVNTLGSLSTSCTTLGPFTTPLPMTFNVSTAVGMPVVFIFSACPCAADSIKLSKVACLLPFNSFGSSTNQSIDLNPFCPLIVGPIVISDSDGNASFSALVPKVTTATSIGTQAAVIGLPCAAPSTYAVTQAYTLDFI